MSDTQPLGLPGPDSGHTQGPESMIISKSLGRSRPRDFPRSRRNLGEGSTSCFGSMA